jgi:two-component system nitrogen regulation sensor histidine kinase NtrY
MLNLIKNAEESIDLKSNNDGKIEIKVNIEDKYTTIFIIDNGCGFQIDLLDRFTEPYVTTKVKGTGLGLAIVKKIILDHNGYIEFGNNKDEGAWFKITLPYNTIDNN